MKQVKRERSPFSVRKDLCTGVILIRTCAAKQPISAVFCELPQWFLDARECHAVCGELVKGRCWTKETDGAFRCACTESDAQANPARCDSIKGDRPACARRPAFHARLDSAMRLALTPASNSDPAKPDNLRQ